MGEQESVIGGGVDLENIRGKDNCYYIMRASFQEDARDGGVGGRDPLSALSSAYLSKTFGFIL